MTFLRETILQTKLFGMQVGIFFIRKLFIDGTLYDTTVFVQVRTISKILNMNNNYKKDSPIN